MADFICQKYMEGKTMAEISKLDGVPPKHIIYQWKRKQPDFRKQLIAAKEDRAEYFHDELIDEARSITHKSEAPVAKVKIDALKWAAERGNPKEYGVIKEEQKAPGPLQIIIDTGIRRTEKEVISEDNQNQQLPGVRQSLPEDLEDEEDRED